MFLVTNENMGLCLYIVERSSVSLRYFNYLTKFLYFAVTRKLNFYILFCRYSSGYETLGQQGNKDFASSYSSGNGGAGMSGKSTGGASQTPANAGLLTALDFFKATYLCVSQLYHSAPSYT